MRDYLEEARERAKKEQKEYEKYNREFLNSWANRADIYKKISPLLQPLFDKILDIVVDYCLEVKKAGSGNKFMEATIDKMADLLNNYYDATEDADEIGEDNNKFYKEDQDISIEKDPKKFYLDDKSINEINKEDVNIDFKILSKTDISNFDEETKISEFTEITYKESVSEYNINKDMNGSFMYISLNGSKRVNDETKKYIYSSAELILHGLPNNKLRIIEHRKEDQNIIDLENIISHIFTDSDIYIILEKEKSDNNSTIDYYLNKIDSLEKLKKYLKDQGKETYSIDNGIKECEKDLKRAKEYEEKYKNKPTEPTLEQLSAINAIKQIAGEAEQIIKNNAKSEL